MNIIQSRQEARRIKISQIKGTLKKIEGGLLANERKRLVMLLMSEWGMSERVVKEYIRLAEFEVRNEKNSKEPN